MNFWCTRGEQTIYDKTFVFRVKLDFILCFYFHQFSLLAGISFWWLCVFFLNYSCQKLSSYLYARAHTFTCKNECIVKWHLFIYLLNSTHSLMLCVKVWFLFVAVAEDEGKKRRDGQYRGDGGNHESSNNAVITECAYFFPLSESVIYTQFMVLCIFFIFCSKIRSTFWTFFKTRIHIFTSNIKKWQAKDEEPHSNEPEKYILTNQIPKCKRV